MFAFHWLWLFRIHTRRDEFSFSFNKRTFSFHFCVELGIFSFLNRWNEIYHWATRTLFFFIWFSWFFWYTLLFTVIDYTSNMLEIISWNHSDRMPFIFSLFTTMLLQQSNWFSIFHTSYFFMNSFFASSLTRFTHFFCFLSFTRHQKTQKLKASSRSVVAQTKNIKYLKLSDFFTPKHLTLCNYRNFANPL